MLQKKIDVIHQSMESNKKNYQTSMKSLLKRTKELEREKTFLAGHLESIESDVKITHEAYKHKLDRQDRLRRQREDQIIEDKRILAEADQRAQRERSDRRA